MPRAPERIPTWVCPSCRVLLDEGSRCDADPRHGVVPLRDARGRAALRRELWDGPQIRLRFTPEDKLLGFVVLGLALCIWAVSSPTPGHIVDAMARALDSAIAWLPLVILPVALFGKYILALLQACFTRLVGLVNLLAMSAAALARLLLPGKKLPRGMFTIAPTRWGHRQLVGTIRADSSITSPVSGKPCIAHVICLCADESFGGPILLGHASTAGFVVDLDDGSSVRVPPGRVWLQCNERHSQRIDDRAAMDAYVATLSRELANRRSLPCDYMTEALLLPGDRVALRGQTRAALGGYRDAHGPERQVVDIPHVRLLRRSSRVEKRYKNALQYKV